MDEVETVQLAFHRLELELYRTEAQAMGISLEAALEAAVRHYFITLLAARKRSRVGGEIPDWDEEKIRQRMKEAPLSGDWRSF